MKGCGSSCYVEVYLEGVCIILWLHWTQAKLCAQEMQDGDTLTQDEVLSTVLISDDGRGKDRKRRVAARLVVILEHAVSIFLIIADVTILHPSHFKHQPDEEGMVARVSQLGRWKECCAIPLMIRWREIPLDN